MNENITNGAENTTNENTPAEVIEPTPETATAEASATPARAKASKGKGKNKTKAKATKGAAKNTKAKATKPKVEKAARVGNFSYLSHYSEALTRHLSRAENAEAKRNQEIVNQLGRGRTAAEMAPVTGLTESQIEGIARKVRKAATQAEVAA